MNKEKLGNLFIAKNYNWDIEEKNYLNYMIDCDYSDIKLFIFDILIAAVPSP